MATAVASSSTNTKHRFARPPLLSDNDQPPARRREPRQVTSRYLSTSSSSSSSSNSTATTSSSESSRRAQTPLIVNRASNALNSTPRTQPRALSADRRRPNAIPVATPLLKSVRSLSVSFQGESYSMKTPKEKTPGDLRKLTPERRKAGVTPVREGRENCKPPDHKQQLRPGRLRAENPSMMSRSLDFGADRAKLTRSGAKTQVLRKSVDEISGNNRNNDVVKQAKQHSSDVLSSDTESVSSKSTTGSERSAQLKGRPRGIARFPAMVSSRVHNAANLVDTSKVNFAKKLQSESQVGLSKEVGVSRGLSPLRRCVRPVSPMKSLASTTTVDTWKVNSGKKLQSENQVGLSKEVAVSRGVSPLRRGVRPVSPMKSLASQQTTAVLRGKASPIRSRGGLENSMNNGNVCATPSILSFANDVRKGKAGESRIADAHDLRMLYNRQLQLRFMNARVEKSLAVQTSMAERSLYNAWSTISRLRRSVKDKRIELQNFRNNMKLYALLKGQEPHLETWGQEEFYHCNSVSGAIKALETSTICLPVAGARIDVQEIQDAINVAVDVMQGVSSTCSLLKKAENMSLLVSELSDISAREHGLLDECKEMLSSTIMPLQVTQWSLRSHILQAQRASKGSASLKHEQH